MTTDKKAQVIQQCRAVAHMANSLAELHKVRGELLKGGFGADDGMLEIVGRRTAYLMEMLGDALNGMDAVDPDEDGWMDPVFDGAHKLWPKP